MSKYLVIDCETTGLNPFENGIITLSAFVFDENKIQSGWNGCNNFWAYSFKIDSYAMKINGFSLTNISNNKYFTHKKTTSVRYEYFSSEQEMMLSFIDYIIKSAKDCDYLMGMNLQFDIKFIEHACHRNSIYLNDLFPREQIDPRIIACAMKDCQSLPKTITKINSSNLYSSYGIDSKNKIHTSDADVIMTHKLWMEMKKTFKGNCK